MTMTMKKRKRSLLVANTLTTSGQNMPLALPLRVDAQPNGFSLAFLMSDPKGAPGTFVSVGEILANVEDAPDGGVRVLMIRGARWEQLVSPPHHSLFRRGLVFSSSHAPLFTVSVS